MDIIGILTLGAFIGAWIYERGINYPRPYRYRPYRHKFGGFFNAKIPRIYHNGLHMIDWGGPSNHRGVDIPFLQGMDVQGVDGGYPNTLPTDKPVDKSEYTSYPSCEPIIIGGIELAAGDFVIAQIAGMWGGIRTDRSYMNEAIKIIEILSAHIVYNTKGGEIHLGKKGSLISKTEFLARDFRRITGAEKKYLTW